MTPTNPSWFEHVDLMQVVLTLCLGYIAWSFNRGLNKFEKSLESLWENYTTITKEFAQLIGEHKMRTSSGISCGTCFHHKRSTDPEGDIN